MRIKTPLPFLLIIIALLSTCTRQEPPKPEPVRLIPLPNEVAIGEGYFEITSQTVVSVENEEQANTAELFFDHFKTVAAWKPVIGIGKEGTIHFKKKDEIKDEGYELTVTPESLTIYAGTNAGFFYGLQTLRQLLPKSFVSNELQKESRWAVPVVTIKDQPRFGWRGFMLDVSRSFYDKEHIKLILDQMAALKLNIFHWHLTDDQGWRIEIKKYPKLTEIGAWRVDYNDHNENNNRWWGRPSQQPGDKATYGGFYTQDDIREVIAYAIARNITIIPEIDVPGHSQSAIAAYPEIACHPGPFYVATGGVFKDNTLCPGKEASFEFIENVLNEVIDLFPSKYIHIGGDECNKLAWKADADCQKRIKAEGLKNEEELQSYFIKRVEKMVNSRDRIMIGWDEILEGGLAPNATVMTWRGEEGGIKAAKDGHPIIMTPSKFCYLDLKQGHTDQEPNFGYSQCLLSACYHYNPIPESLKDRADLILGVQGNLWTESLPDWDKLTYMAYPRLFAIAENGWSAQGEEDWDGFIDRLYPQLERLDYRKIRYANSAFNVWIGHKGNEDKINIDLHTEANGLDIKYTLNGTDPTMESSRYTAPFTLNQTADLKTAAYRNGVMQGKITSQTFYIHKAKNPKVVYHTAYLKNKNGGGDAALVDYNYGSNWTIDSLWQGFQSPNVEFDLVFEEAIEVKSVRMNFLQVAISGIYMPEEITILGAEDANTFKELGNLSLKEPAMVQGRYIQRTKIDLPKIKVKTLKIQLKSVNPIYPGHHRQGEQSKLYLDEVVVE